MYVDDDNGDVKVDGDGNGDCDGDAVKSLQIQFLRIFEENNNPDHHKFEFSPQKPSN